MRLLALVVSVALVIGGFLPVFAQQSTGPATLENLLQDGGATPAQRPVAVDATEPSTTAGRIQGAVTRPKDGIQHPDLDAAWTEYDKQIEAVAEAVEQAIERQLNAAAAAGDLDEALKWKTAGEQFKKDGRIPEGLERRNRPGKAEPRPTKSETPPPSRIAEAQEKLATAYEAVEKGLVQSHDLEKAKHVRAERAVVFGRAKSPDKRFLTHLAERGFNAGPERTFAKNGVTPEGQPLAVRGIRVPHALWLHPPSNGFSRVTFDVPDSASRIVGAVAMNDSTQDQRTPLTFAILDERDNVLWSSKPIKGRGAEQAFDVPLGKTKAVTLKVMCPGDWRFAHAVWVDPYFLVQ